MITQLAPRSPKPPMVSSLLGFSLITKTRPVTHRRSPISRRPPGSSGSLAQAAYLLATLLALTGFVCTHKIQAEEECLSSNVLCYECDSRYDPNCADPFDFLDTSTSTTNTQPFPPPPMIQPTTQNQTQEQAPPDMTMTMQDQPALVRQQTDQQHQQYRLVESFRSPGPLVAPVVTNNSTGINNINMTAINRRSPKKLPPVMVCHGCCVKITSRLPDGVTYVKRTCTSNIQINYFMVGLVCMRESGDRGKMCFCETDYCNGQPSSIHLNDYLTLFRMIIVALITTAYLSTMRTCRLHPTS